MMSQLRYSISLFTEGHSPEEYSHYVIPRRSIILPVPRKECIVYLIYIPLYKNMNNLNCEL